MTESSEVNEKLAKDLDAALSTTSAIEEEARSAGYNQCVWHKRCYYCRVGGRWRLIRCYA